MTQLSRLYRQKGGAVTQYGGKTEQHIEKRRSNCTKRPYKHLIDESYYNFVDEAEACRANMYTVPVYGHKQVMATNLKVTEESDIEAMTREEFSRWFANPGASGLEDLIPIAVSGKFDVESGSYKEPSNNEYVFLWQSDNDLALDERSRPIMPHEEGKPYYWVPRSLQAVVVPYMSGNPKTMRFWKRIASGMSPEEADSGSYTKQERQQTDRRAQTAARKRQAQQAALRKPRAVAKAKKGYVPPHKRRPGAAGPGGGAAGWRS